VHGPDRRVPRRVLLPKTALIAEDTAATPFVALDLGEVEMGDDSPVDDSGFAYSLARSQESGCQQEETTGTVRIQSSSILGSESSSGLRIRSVVRGSEGGGGKTRRSSVLRLELGRDCFARGAAAEDEVEVSGVLRNPRESLD
jgi:hypothetical protein